MTALSSQTKIEEYAAGCARYLRRFTVASETTVFKGALTAVNASGYAVNAADSTGLAVLGIAANTANAGESVDLISGLFAVSNDTTAPVGVAELNKKVFVKDNATVAKSSVNAVPAGILRFFSPDNGRPVVEIGNLQLN